MNDWRKSSYSNDNGGACVEVAGNDWRKASYSNDAGGDCVEVASAEGVMVRDTTNREGGTLAFTAEAWGAFMAGLR